MISCFPSGCYTETLYAFLFATYTICLSHYSLHNCYSNYTVVVKSKFMLVNCVLFVSDCDVVLDACLGQDQDIWRVSAVYSHLILSGK
jgi:hypothetical protein